MSLYITSLNSGSNGNCYYIGNDAEAVLIDAGISCREIEKRISNLKLSMQKVKAVFISHEHIDHISGVEVLSKKFNLPVYITRPTLANSKLRLEDFLIKSFKEKEPINIGGLTVTPFTKHHDAADPYSFIVEGNGVKIGVITDIGKSCEQVIHYFKQCHACFLESNYDEQMLENGNYPIHLKNRIRKGRGHLSNAQALELFIKHRPSFMSHLILSHLSKNNNTPELVNELFIKHAGNTKIVIAPRHAETILFVIDGKDEINFLGLKKELPTRFSQLSLFE
jgi:phosphoribosyl 1,2-cyclic phosphodiesterase